jgi:uncharacterized protein YdaU (DUF1376 family)
MQLETQSKYNYFKLFATEFIVQTVDMTPVERSAYILLLCQAWGQSERGTLPTDDESLAKLALIKLREWQKIKARVLASFQMTDSRLQKIELVQQWEQCQLNSRHGLKGATARWEERKQNESAGSTEPNVEE